MSIGLLIVDHDRTDVAVRPRNGGAWLDPHGGTFSADDIIALDAFARGAVDVLVLAGRHIYGARLVARFGGAS